MTVAGIGIILVGALGVASQYAEQNKNKTISRTSSASQESTIQSKSTDSIEDASNISKNNSNPDHNQDTSSNMARDEGKSPQGLGEQFNKQNADEASNQNNCLLVYRNAQFFGYSGRDQGRDPDDEVRYFIRGNEVIYIQKDSTSGHCFFNKHGYLNKTNRHHDYYKFLKTGTQYNCYDCYNEFKIEGNNLVEYTKNGNGQIWNAIRGIR